MTGLASELLDRPAETARRPPADPDGSADLLSLALSRPAEALRQARSLLAANPPAAQGSVARQAIGLVLRETGDVEAAVRELRLAAGLARRSGSAERLADVSASLGLALVFSGRTRAGRLALDTAVAQSSGQLRDRSLLRRGGALQVLGLHREAMADLSAAIGSLRSAGDHVWEARALTARAFVHLGRGAVRRAVVDLERAERLFLEGGQELEYADAVLHRGVLHLRNGDLPAALTCLDEAETRYERLGTVEPALSIERCTVLLAAGLPFDAAAEAERALERLERVKGQQTRRAELLLVASRCALAAADPPRARERASQAKELFSRQRRAWWTGHAELSRLSAVHAAGRSTPESLRAAVQVAETLASLESPQAVSAQLLAGRTARDLGRDTEADRHFAAAGRSRLRGPAHARAVGWLAEALRAELHGNSRRLLACCRRGLDAVDEHRSIFGSSELRAQASAHGLELAALGQRQAVRLNRTRMLLCWSERWRASALSVPPVRPSDDASLRADLVSLRMVTVRLQEARAKGTAAETLRREQQRLERAVRTRTLRSRRAAPDGPTRQTLDVEELVHALGDDTLIELIDVSGELHAVVRSGGSWHRFTVGPTARALQELDFARFGLTRLARGGAGPRAERAFRQICATGASLQTHLLGPAARMLADQDVVIAPPGRLNAVPWALLPALADRAVTVAPSASSWLRACRQRHDARPGRVVLAYGPDLPAAQEEITRLAEVYRQHPDVQVLGGGSAGAEQVLTALDGASLAHVVAHGTFRADSPLFSALHMDDGPVTAYDLERLHRTPTRIVLSSCNSGRTAAAGSDELLGLISALLPLGTIGLIASVVPVDDAASVPLMTALHRHLGLGCTLARALREARRHAGDDAVTVACGWSLVALGAG